MDKIKGKNKVLCKSYWREDLGMEKLPFDCFPVFNYINNQNWLTFVTQMRQ